jgi:hypothetical protein
VSIDGIQSIIDAIDEHATLDLQTIKSELTETLNKKISTAFEAQQSNVRL